MQYLWAFLVGGALCAIGQLLIDLTKLTPARILVAYVVSGVILGAVGLYQPLVDFAGAGASVPLTGFGNLLAKGMKKAVEDDGLLGIFTGGFTACSAGVTAAMIFALAVSLMLKCSCPFSNAARSVILPSCVNFNALESRFSTICLVRNGSPIYKRFKGSPQSYSNSKCLAFAIGLKLI